MDKKVLKWNFIFQYGWVLTNIINSILLLPLYLKNIDKDTLGVWLATGNILAWMTMVDPGLGDILQQKIAVLSGQKNEGEISRTIGSGFIACVFVLLISILFGFLCYIFVGNLINKDVSHYPNLSMALMLSVVATGLSLVSFGMSGINQGLHNSAQVAICSISANFLFLFVNLLFLFLGFGVLSIALANLFRAAYINFYNIISMLTVVKKRGMEIIFKISHFKEFIRIFSVTSTSKVITSLSYSVEMIVLARYIPPSMITIYEINKRPINILYSLIGRHSVALMPLISHAKGLDDKVFIIDLIFKQFRFYSYAVLFTCLIFIFNYDNLITAWTGDGQFIGQSILYILVGGFFFSLISYFMATVGYALGDIKMNSIYGIVRNVIFGVLIFLSARYYGIVGTLTVTLFFNCLIDMFFYTFRLFKLGYMKFAFFTNSFRYWIIILPIAVVGGWMFRYITGKLIPSSMHFSKLIVGCGTFTIFFVTLVLFTDKQMQQKAKSLLTKFLMAPLAKLKRASVNI